MIEVKRCKSCSRLLEVDRFDWRKTSTGRRRRKETCRECLERLVDKRKNYVPSPDSRDKRCDLEEVFHQWTSISYSAPSPEQP